MKTTAEAVKQVIASQPVDVLVAEDMGSGDKCGYVQGTAAELQAYVDFLEANMMVPYRVKLSRSTVDKKRGVKSTEDRPFIFVLLGRSGQQNAPMNGPSPAISVPAPPIELAREAAANGVRNELLMERLAQLEARTKELEQQLAYAEAELDEAIDDDEPVNAAQPSASGWNDPEVVKSIVEVFKPIGEAAAKLVSGGFRANGAPKSVATNAEVQASAESLSDEEKRILVAVRNFRKHQPDMANDYIGQLVHHYAAESIPSERGEA